MKIEEIVNDSEVLYSSDEIKVGISNIADAINEYFGDIKDCNCSTSNERSDSFCRLPYSSAFI